MPRKSASRRPPAGLGSGARAPLSPDPQMEMGLRLPEPEASDRDRRPGPASNDHGGPLGLREAERGGPDGLASAAVPGNGQGESDGVGGSDSRVSALLIVLTPEERERVRRMAEEDGRSVARVLGDAVTVAWVRFGCRRGLKPGEW